MTPEGAARYAPGGRDITPRAHPQKGVTSRPPREVFLPKVSSFQLPNGVQFSIAIDTPPQHLSAADKTRHGQVKSASGVPSRARARESRKGESRGFSRVADTAMRSEGGNQTAAAVPKGQTGAVRPY